MTEVALRACLQDAGPIRPTFCNIPVWAQAFLYLAALITVSVFAFGMWRHVRLWAAAQRSVDARHLGHAARRMVFALRDVLGQRATRRRRLPGVFHSGIFYGFALLFVGTVLATLDWEVTHKLSHMRFLTGAFYVGYEFVLDTAGFAFTIGLLLAIWRRQIEQPHHVLGSWDFVLWSLLLVSVSGFALEGLRIAMVPIDWGAASWVGQGIANLVHAAPESFVREVAPALHLWLWLGHAAAALAFIAAIPYTNAVHMVTAAINATMQSIDRRLPGAALAEVDIERAEVYGASRLADFTWKQCIGFDSCVRCGRCETVCPAYLAGTLLNPKAIVVTLSRALREELDRPVWAGATLAADGAALVGENAAVAPDALWACTTCGACVASCPAHIEIVDDIVEMRRHLTLSEGAPPDGATAALRQMALAGNPWGYAQEDRLAWAEGLEVAVARPGDRYEVLYWVGCAASYDPRSQRIARATARLLTAAGVRFAVMREERCHCESARRLGEEYLFQTAAAENVTNLARYEFVRLVAHCPHCVNTLRNEYPQFGASYDVVHHSQLLAELLAAGRLRGLESDAGRVVFHDSCYLGRYNREYEAPRAVLRGGGATVLEMARRREDGLCCGGGGGRMWFEDAGVERRIEQVRLTEALGERPEVVGVACPFCLTMLESAVAATMTEGVAVMDVAEVLVRGLDLAASGGSAARRP